MLCPATRDCMPLGPAIGDCGANGGKNALGRAMLAVKISDEIDAGINLRGNGAVDLAIGIKGGKDLRRTTDLFFRKIKNFSRRISRKIFTFLCSIPKRAINFAVEDILYYFSKTYYLFFGYFPLFYTDTYQCDVEPFHRLYFD